MMDIVIGAIVGALIAGVGAYLVILAKRRAHEVDLERMDMQGKAEAATLAQQAKAATAQLAEAKTELDTLRSERDTLLQANTKATTELTEAQKNFAEQKKALDEIKATMDKAFKAASADALKSNAESFLKLAEQNFGKHTKEFDGLLKPIRETLGKYELQTQKVEKHRQEAYGSLMEQVKALTIQQTTLRQETQNLVSALQKPQVRGQWGELQLKRVVQLAGMDEYCDFDQQVAVEGGAQRPDMVIHMPSGRDVIVDAKAVMEGYMQAVEAKTDEERKAGLTRHVRHLRDQVKGLALKSYWDQFENTPEFVVLFLPGESFLYAALEEDHALIEDAMKQKVIIATPTTLMALLKAVAFGWRQEQITQNARQISDLGEELYTRIQALATHIVNLGKNLKRSSESYDKMIGSLERNVLPSARRFRDLGATAKEEIPILDATSIEPRKLTSSEMTGGEDTEA
ncbi:MAG: DNA recombination protein RmuC [Phycisphaerales bacterium]|jgi:DNA recombination protein RmuC|nr:DNA recombination protein RmuC [Phycisphaerales bacterium]MBT7171863.1 DNA recombination protein RmuC [Phycisphaerales bacterium]